MELHFMDPQKPSVLGKLRPALLFAALWLAALGMLELFSPFAFVGLLPLLMLPFLPQRVRRWGGVALLVLTLGFFALRFSAITDGLQMLANRMFTISESCQAYEYDRFPVTERRPALQAGTSRHATALRCTASSMSARLRQWRCRRLKKRRHRRRSFSRTERFPSERSTSCFMRWRF